MVTARTMTGTMRFTWNFDDNHRDNPDLDISNITNTKSLNQEKFFNMKQTPVTYIGTSFSPFNRGQKFTVESKSKRKLFPLASKDNLNDQPSHKPYASSSLWKPSNSTTGERDRSRKAFLTLTPVSSTSSVGQSQYQSRPPGVPLISMTPPLKIDTSLQHHPPPLVSEVQTKDEDLASPNIQAEPLSNTGCIFCDAEAARRAKLSEAFDPESQVKLDPNHRESLNHELHDDNITAHYSTCNAEVDNKPEAQTQNGFSKLSKLPGIKPRGSLSERSNSDSEQTRSESPEVDVAWQPALSYPDSSSLAQGLWENPKLSRKDTVLDSIADRNLLDRKTLFSKKVNASYARITHENTVILPPVECNRRQRDVPGDSSYLMEKKYVHEAFKRNQGNIRDIAITRHKDLEFYGREPQINSKRRNANKKIRSQRQLADKNVGKGNDVTRHEHLVQGNTLTQTDQVQAAHRNQNHADALELRLPHDEHSRKHRASRVNSHDSSTVTIFPNTSNKQRWDSRIDFSHSERDREKYPFQQTRFRLPAKQNANPYIRRQDEYVSSHTRSESRLSPLKSQTSQFVPPSHETTHFCDVLGKNSCSQCREQNNRRRLKNSENNSVSKTGLRHSLDGLGRNGIVSPPPAPSSSPTLFMPVDALHKVVIRVKDREGVLSVTSVGVNEDVVRRTTA